MQKFPKERGWTFPIATPKFEYRQPRHKVDVAYQYNHDALAKSVVSVAYEEDSGPIHRAMFKLIQSLGPSGLVSPGHHAFCPVP